MAITNLTLAQSTKLLADGVDTGYVADKTMATIPGTSTSITTNMVIGAVVGGLLVKILTD